MLLPRTGAREDFTARRKVIKRKGIQKVKKSAGKFLPTFLQRFSVITGLRHRCLPVLKRR